MDRGQACYLDCAIHRQMVPGAKSRQSLLRKWQNRRRFKLNVQQLIVAL